MSERRAYVAPAKGKARRRFEWVELPEGEVCVWSMNMAEATQIAEQASRPKIDPRGGVDAAASGAWEVFFSCYSAEPGDPEARRVFPDVGIVYDLPWDDFQALIQAAMRVNGKDAETVESTGDFMPARQGAENGTSSISA
jgi:hypothetical protein